jgi:hypothetical protein
MEQISLFQSGTQEIEIVCHWNGGYCQDCGWCEGGQMLQEARRRLDFTPVFSTCSSAPHSSARVFAPMNGAG